MLLFWREGPVQGLTRLERERLFSLKVQYHGLLVIRGATSKLPNLEAPNLPATARHNGLKLALYQSHQTSVPTVYVLSVLDGWLVARRKTARFSLKIQGRPVLRD